MVAEKAAGVAVESVSIVEQTSSCRPAARLGAQQDPKPLEAAPYCNRLVLLDSDQSQVTEHYYIGAWPSEQKLVPTVRAG